MRESALVLLCAFAAFGCAARARTGEAQSRLYRYTDSSGLGVTTTVTAVEQEIGPNVTLRGRYWADYIEAQARPYEGPASGAQEHEHEHPEPVFQSVRLAEHNHDHDHGPGVDTVTAASTIVSRNRTLQKWRHEGLIGTDVRPFRDPLQLGLFVRASHEPDFRSSSGVLRAQRDFFDNHTTVAAFVGRANDYVRPLVQPPGDQLWPARHNRWITGLSVSQVLSPTMLVSAGGIVTLQHGRLANPYRRALVRTTEFSEVVPDRRNRWLVYGQLSWHVGWQTAVHGRGSVYVDSWNVFALIPEVAVVKEIREARLLLSLTYRFYEQSRADFYAARYDNLQPFLSGDPRLGRITDHTGRVDVTWTVLGTPDSAGAVSALGGYAVSWMSYHDLVGPAVVAHIPTAGLSVIY